MLFFIRQNTRNLLILLLFIASGPLVLNSQVDAYFSSGKFNTPKNEPFIETYLTIVGKTLAAKPVGDKFRNSINIELKIYKDSLLVKASKYNLLGPAFDASASAPSFIDNQRYALPNGRYNLELTLRDNYDSVKKPLQIKAPILVRFGRHEIQSSSIQPLESFKKSTSQNPISKSGYDLVPYTSDFYPETSHELAFYLEAYNTDLFLGEGKPFVYSYYIELNADLSRPGNYGAFKKQSSARVNPLLAKMDISKLPSGNYNLVVELRDSENMMHLQKKFFFQRLNMEVDAVERQRYSESIAEYVGRTNDPDTLKMFVECLWPIADGADKERIINHSVKKDPQIMKNFVADFWQRRAADTANPVKLWADYYKKVQQVMVLFKCGKQKGYYTDRGRVYLQYGPPNQRSQQNNENNTYPYEIWQYYRITDGVNGQFFTNRKFVFVNKMLGDDCFMLIHSDMRGEVNNPRWQFELTRRNNNGISDPDNTTPGGTEFNQFNEIYSNPR